MEAARQAAFTPIRYLLSGICGGEMLSGLCGISAHDDDFSRMADKLMDYEDVTDDEPLPARPSGWFGAALDSPAPRDEAASAMGHYAPPSVLAIRAAEGASSATVATWTEAAAPGRSLDDLNALMARVEELENAGDLDAAARLLSGAIQRR
ncbi:hypothetical protein T492DRAFT_1084698 [Pavlovales sp. CCMP2436]|nr:hypothetical protein T492DRAFT_1084684 [Pavlovales sp. CCMP2436]KAJ1619546.1 hypothetical protein T492DRAFT_1084698 [Pavlovales sp. CCMP2436]|mmetsp:Transcript_5579/g.14573  ORF Transcript_5579/g.14573 Transcript_5579/m.14573 type:complete len:151 (-) Transcript_5579:322-774(-)